MKNKRGQFFLIATIIIVVIIVSLSVVLNYSTKSVSQNTDELAKTLSIESAKVFDYELYTSDNTAFDDFSEKYSEYAGSDKDIYFIFVDEDSSIEEAYKYTEGSRVDFSSDLDVSGGKIQFTLDSKVYEFNEEQGKNFYFIIVYDTGGERYVYQG